MRGSASAFAQGGGPLSAPQGVVGSACGPSVESVGGSELPPRFEPTQEVRFAVVMYGGVSLAIYINGVVQELFNLVRATAPERPLGSGPAPERVGSLTEPELAGTPGVYRDLGMLLRWGGLVPDELDADEEPVVRTRFVVDILSGTSAGGINGIFLAKALANEQRIDELKRLWVDEGDIALLINDRESLADLRKLPLQRPPRSVLNSQRFYVRALEALCRMGENAPGVSAYVDELDLWITATDLPGLSLPIKLSDRVVQERRHRNVFHFAYWAGYATGAVRNDFVRANDPFLAYTARCTASFPVAFEPMTLADIDDVVSTFQEYPLATCGSDAPAWGAFFPDYVREGKFYRERAFADGGYLDNKPFTYATRALARRRADVPVDRKLIYIEPDPSHPEAEYTPQARPDALHNLQAVFTLPRSETIREDLEQLLERNRLIRRRQALARALEHQPGALAIERKTEPPELAAWLEKDLAALVSDWGPAYGPYFRLKVARVVDELAEAITRATGFDDASDEQLAIRALVEAWVERRYAEFRAPGDRRPSRNRFLFRFDLGYRLRRLAFLQARIDELLRLDDRAKNILERLARAELAAEGPERDAFVATLRAVKRALNDIYVGLRTTGRSLRARDGGWLREELARFEPNWISERELEYVLEGPPAPGLVPEDPQALLDRAGDVLEGMAGRNLAWIEIALARRLRAAFKTAAAGCEAALTAPLPEPSALALLVLRHYYDRYENYDMTILPLAQEDTGEADVVEVIRIAPEDATSLIDERHSDRRKLGGVAVRHFGGFFDRGWRRNDLMWGRLDAAERILSALLPPGHPQLQPLLKRAQLAIVQEELRAADGADVVTLLVEGLLRQGSDTASQQALKSLLEEATGQQLKPALEAALAAALGPEPLRQFLATSFTVNRRLDARTGLRALGRGSRVLGQVIDAIPGNKAVKRPAAWMARFGSLLWGLVELATPGTWWRRGFHYWLAVLLAIALLLLAIGVVFSVPGAQKSGWIVVALSLSLAVARGVVSDAITGRTRVRTLVLPLALAVAVAFTLLELRHVGGDASDLWHWVRGLWTSPPKKT